MLTVAFRTLGCKLNQTETAMLVRDFQERGYIVVDWNDCADVAVLNTCTVTGRSDSKCRQAIRQILRKNPETTLIVAGCYAQVSPDDIRRLDGVDYIFGVQEKLDLFDHFPGPGKRDEPVVAVSPVAERKQIIPHDIGDFREQTRATLRIQSGCNNRCAYCIVPIARGPSRSLPVEEVVMQADSLVQTGFREVILTGVHVGEYGSEWEGGPRLPELLKELVQIDALERIRLTSLEPENVTDDLLDVIEQHPKICRHFHLSIQNGSAEILKAMRRRSTVAQIHGVVQSITQRFSHTGLGGDFIVGFSGESDVHFQETVDFIRSYPFTYLHVFPFSARKGTAAAEMPNQIPERIRMERARFLRGIGEEKKRAFQSTWIGKKVDVLFENRNQNGMVSGFTSEYLRVEVPFDPAFANKIVPVRIEGVRENGVRGSVQ